MRNAFIIWILSTAIIFCGCASEDKFTTDRWADFTDIFKADVGIGAGAGAQLRATEFFSLGAGGGVMWKTGFKGRYSGSWKDIEIGWPAANIALLGGIIDEIDKSSKAAAAERRRNLPPVEPVTHYENGWGPYKGGACNGTPASPETQNNPNSKYPGGGSCNLPESNSGGSGGGCNGCGSGSGDGKAGEACGTLLTAYFCIPMDFSFVGLRDDDENAAGKYVPGGYSSFSIFGANLHPLAPDFLGFSRRAPDGAGYFDLEAGVFLGFTSLHLGMSPGQLWDFVFGWFGLDPAADDVKIGE